MASQVKKRPIDDTETDWILLPQKKEREHDGNTIDSSFFLKVIREDQHGTKVYQKINEKNG
jgi:hypothetical protein